MNNTYKVYVLLDAEYHITAINSDAFLTDQTSWTYIDEGSGDRYHHAQNNYLDKPIADVQGRFNYRLLEGVPTEIPEEGKPAVPVLATPDDQIANLQVANKLLSAQIKAVSESNAFLEECMVEMAGIVYA